MRNTDSSRQPFRSSDGLLVNPTNCLRLSLRDFATDAIPLGQESSVLSVSYRQLYDDLVRAEELQQARQPENGIRSTRRTKKRKLSSSPDEALRTGDEAQYISQEREVEERVAAEDADFLAPATKRRA